MPGLDGLERAARDSASRLRGAESLAQEQLGMPRGIVRERADDLEAVALIERRSLEAVRLQRELYTAASSCLRLRRLEQPPADMPPAHVLAHPERIDPAGPAPAPAVHAGHQLAMAIGLDAQKLAEISDARRLDVELVDLVDQTPHSRAL